MTKLMAARSRRLLPIVHMDGRLHLGDQLIFNDTFLLKCKICNDSKPILLVFYCFGEDFTWWNLGLWPLAILKISFFVWPRFRNSVTVSQDLEPNWWCIHRKMKCSGNSVESDMQALRRLLFVALVRALLELS